VSRWAYRTRSHGGGPRECSGRALQPLAGKIKKSLCDTRALKSGRERQIRPVPVRQERRIEQLTSCGHVRPRPRV
jgi:hypothetical protein